METNTTNINTENSETVDIYLKDNQNTYLLDKYGVYLTTTDKKESDIMATKKYVSLEKLGLYDEKLKKYLADADAEILAQAEGFGANYEPAGSIATAQSELQGNIDAVEAKANAAQAAADAAQGEIDALETLVGTIPDTATATNIVAYVQEKTAGIATDTALEELTGRVAQAETDIGDIEKDYLKAADKTELSDLIGAEAETARAAEKANADAIKAISDDYLKAADKTTLQENIDAVDALVDTLIGEDTGKSARTIANEELAKQLIAEGAQESLDTLAEIAAWIQSHPDDASAMNKAIEDLEALVGVLPEGVTATTVIGCIQEVVAAEKSRAEGIEAGLAERITNLETSVGDGGSVQDMIDGAIEAAMEAEETRVDGLLEGKVDTVDGKGLSTNDLTNDLKQSYDTAYTHSQEAHAPANAQANVIESVKVNGTALTIADKAVDITVPTDNADLTNGAGYLVAADIANKADKATTLAGYGIADAYTSAQTDTAIANAMANFVECSEQEINDLFA